MFNHVYGDAQEEVLKWCMQMQASEVTSAAGNQMAEAAEYVKEHVHLPRVERAGQCLSAIASTRACPSQCNMSATRDAIQ